MYRISSRCITNLADVPDILTDVSNVLLAVRNVLADWSKNSMINNNTSDIKVLI